MRPNRPGLFSSRWPFFLLFLPHAHACSKPSSHVPLLSLCTSVIISHFPSPALPSCFFACHLLQCRRRSSSGSGSPATCSSCCTIPSADTPQARQDTLATHQLPPYMTFSHPTSLPCPFPMFGPSHHSNSLCTIAVQHTSYLSCTNLQVPMQLPTTVPAHVRFCTPLVFTMLPTEPHQT